MEVQATISLNEKNEERQRCLKSSEDTAIMCNVEMQARGTPSHPTAHTRVHGQAALAEKEELARALKISEVAALQCKAELQVCPRNACTSAHARTMIALTQARARMRRMHGDEFCRQRCPTGKSWSAK